MIAENVAELIARVKSVPALTASAGLVIGNREADPGMLKVPLPCAWVMYGKDVVDEAPYGAGMNSMPGLKPVKEAILATFCVVIYVPYTSESDMLSVQFPLLESVICAVRKNGEAAPSGHRFRYIGQRIIKVAPDRIGYEQNYTLDSIF